VACDGQGGGARGWTVRSRRRLHKMLVVRQSHPKKQSSILAIWAAGKQCSCMRSSRVPHSVLRPLSGEREEGDPHGTIHASTGARGCRRLFLAPRGLRNNVSPLSLQSASAVRPNAQPSQRSMSGVRCASLECASRAVRRSVCPHCGRPAAWSSCPCAD
jgi:hypothetical protein